jgi:RNA recognition motif-containing protein
MASPPAQPATTTGRDPTRRIFLGNLSIHSSGEDIQKLLHQYGKITVLNRSGPGPHPQFTFVKLEDPRDAEDAVHTWDGYVFNGRRLKVEREIRGHKGKKSQHKATQPGGKFQTVNKPRGRTNSTLPTKNPPLTEQLIEFEDNLEAKNALPPPLTVEETRLAATHNLE